MKPICTVRLLHPTPHGVLLATDTPISIRVSLLAPGLGRVLFLRDDTPRQPTTWMVPAPAEADTPWEGRDRRDDSVWPAPAIVRQQTETTITLRAEHLTVRIHLDPFRLEWLLPDGRVFLADRPSMPYMFSTRTDALEHHAIRHETDRYYGLGDKTGPLDLHGRRLRTRMTDALGYDPKTGDPLYKHWPFLITRDAEHGISHGILYDNMAEASFDLGAVHDNYHGLFRSYEAAGGDLDYYVFPGPRLADVTPRFLELTGRTALPPRWSLGFAQTAMAIADSPDAQARIEAFIETCATEQVPVSAFHFGSGYTSIGPKRYVFNWNRDKFPDPEGLMRRFHAAGMKVVANLKPCLLDDHPRYAEARDAHAFVEANGQPLLAQFWDGQGAHIDFTAPAGVTWWQKGMETAVLGTGIDVGWNDNNEYELWDEDAACAAGPLALVRPAQSLLMTRATRDAQRKAAPTERVFTVTRAGCPGIQRYAQTWSGDNTTSWETLRWNLRTGLQMALSGMLNIGHDIGGFWGPIPDPELLIRWTQTGVIHPRFIMNSWKPDGVYTSPWLHPEALPEIRAAIRLRYRLLPYLYSLMHAASATNAPVLQPTFSAFEDDPNTFADSDTLLLGPFLLAAPVVHPGARHVRVYLPAGPEAWFDLATGERFAPGQHVDIEAPLGKLPLFARAGAILPMTDGESDVERGRRHDEPSRCLHLFPGPGAGHSDFVLMEDDGISATANSLCLHCRMTWDATSIALHVEAEGDHAGPATIRVALPPSEQRPLRLSSGQGAPSLTS